MYEEIAKTMAAEAVAASAGASPEQVEQAVRYLTGDPVKAQVAAAKRMLARTKGK